MFCQNCGEEIPDQARFCPKCGAPTENVQRADDVKNEEETPKQKREDHDSPEYKDSGKKSRKWIIVVVVVAAVVAAGLIYFFASPAHRLSRDLKKGDLDAAESVYSSGVEDHNIQTRMANSLISGEASEIYDAYADDKISYDEASDYLDALSQMPELNISGGVSDQIEKLDDLYSSREAYEKAEDYYADENYKKAIDAYREVDESDADNYNDAQEKIEEASDIYRTQIIDRAEDASTDEEYVEAINQLNSALGVFPEDEEISGILQEMKSTLLKKVAINTPRIFTAENGEQVTLRDALEYNGHYYTFCDEDEMTWDEAKDYCESQGGHLVTITSEEEQNAVYTYVVSVAEDEDIWIGIYDADAEDDWTTWITGESVSYTNWGVGEPDDAGNGQDYGVIVNGNRSGEGYDIAPGEWDDVGDVTHHFICEWEPSK